MPLDEEHAQGAPTVSAPVTPPKAMPALVVNSVHLPNTVLEAMLVTNPEELAAPRAAEDETLAARKVVHERLIAARNAVGIVPLPSVLPPPPAPPLALPEPSTAPSLATMLAQLGIIAPWVDPTRVRGQRGAYCGDSGQQGSNESDRTTGYRQVERGLDICS